MTSSAGRLPAWDDTTGYSSVVNSADADPNAAVDWGPISLPDPLSFDYADLPPLDPLRVAALRFSDGDLIIKLTPSPEEWLLVHRSVIAVGMPLLEPQLRKPWAHPEAITSTTTGKDVEVYTLALKHGDETLFLGGEDLVDFKQNPFIVPFPLSKLALSDTRWPLKKGDRGSRLSAVIYDIANTHLALISAVYADCRPGLAQTREWFFPMQEHFGVWDSTEYLNEDIPYLSHLLAYACYYGAFFEVSRQIFHLLSSFPQLSDAMSLKPISWLRLGVKMQSQKIYHEALRHLITGQRHGWHVISQELGMTARQAWTLFRPRIERLKATEQHLLGLFGSLVVVKPKLWFTCDALSDQEMSLQDLNKISATLARIARALRQHDYMARGAFGDWMVEKKAEAEEARNAGSINRKATRTSTTLHGICTALLHQDNAREARKIFDDQAVQRYVNSFNIEEDVKPHVHDRIKVLLDEARSLTLRTYQTREEQQGDGTTLTYRCSFFTRNGGLTSSHFPYLALDEEDVPWEEMPSFVTGTVSDGSPVSLVTANKEVLRAYGLRTAGAETPEEIFEDAMAMHI